MFTRLAVCDDVPWTALFTAQKAHLSCYAIDIDYTGVPPTFNEKLGLNLLLNFKLVLMNFYVPILSRLLHHTCNITERHAQ